jgi:dTDP-4-dehydrorhamnose reductase
MDSSLVLVTGSEGLVGSRFIEASSHRSNLHSPKLVEFDMTNKPQVSAIFKSFDFATVVNFAAYTDVSGAEGQRGDRNGSCWKVNVEGVRNLAEAVASYRNQIRFIHISTDMVFSGDKEDKGPYKEKHKPEEVLDKVTWYGYTKGQGESIVEDILGEQATILRIIYPVRAAYNGKLDYLRKPLSLYDQGKLYPMFSDQQVSISFIDEVISALDKIIDSKLTGVFHASSRDVTTPYELVSYMLEKTRKVKNVVKTVKLESFVERTKSPVYRYPKYGGLKVKETEKALGLRFSTWKEIIDKLVEQGLGK